MPRRVLCYVLSVEGGKKPQIRSTNKKPSAPAAVVAVTARTPANASLNTKNSEIAVTVAEVTVEDFKVESALKIISEESGVAVADLTNDCIFSDIGIDSLLSLVITSRLREELKMEMELDDLFTKYPSVKELKEFLAPRASNKTIVPPSPMYTATEIVSRAPAAEHIVQKVDSVLRADFQAALKIIAEESGVAITDLTDDCIFSDIGIDSLLSLVIVSRFREEVALEMESESIFTDYPSIKQLKNLLSAGTVSEEPTRPSSAGPDRSDEENSAELSSATSEDSTFKIDWELKQAPSSVPAATSVFLQGHPKSATQALFLFPDGAGSATSYSRIPRVDAQIAVVGLNSPESGRFQMYSR